MAVHRCGALNIDGCRVGDDNNGRWPANVCHDGSDEVLAAFPDAPGQIARASTNDDARKTQNVYGTMRRGSRPGGFGNVGADRGDPIPNGPTYRDKGSAARFFYCAKASKADRGEGNTHPTVKPTALMRWLVRLVTPPGGVVLDPFAGSGSTGRAAAIEGFDSILIEQDASYAEIARARSEAA
jgi:site-specific DNA-methyltransferase (adenine-specific)